MAQSKSLSTAQLRPRTLRREDVFTACCAALAVTTLSSGCARTHQYLALASGPEIPPPPSVRAWEGREVDELLKVHGPPTRTFKTPSGSTIYVYEQSFVLQDDMDISVSSRSSAASASAASARPSAAALLLAAAGTSSTTTVRVSGGGSRVQQCQTDLEISRAGEIKHVREEGNACDDLGLDAPDDVFRSWTDEYAKYLPSPVVCTLQSGEHTAVFRGTTVKLFPSEQIWGTPPSIRALTKQWPDHTWVQLCATDDTPPRWFIRPLECCNSPIEAVEILPRTPEPDEQ